MTLPPSTNRTLSSYDKQINILRAHGYKPIAVCQMMFEDTFVFETDEEAYAAHKELEVENNLTCGWYYGRERFMQTVKDYEEFMNNECTAQIFWLDEEK